MAATPSDAELVRETIARLERVTADLDGHIERRAAFLAAPSISAAQVAASERVAEAEHDLERKQDVIEELRRRLDPLQRQADETADARDQLARALGHHPLGRFLPGLVTEAVAALAANECDGSDVHIDWHSTPEEYRELREVLLGQLSAADSPYVQRLRAEGKLGDG